MQITPMRVTAEPHVRADEHAAAVDAIARPAAIAAVTRPVQATHESDAGLAHERGRHELRARDMEVRTQDALGEPDGTLDLLPSYEYALGPDGMPYAVEQSIAPVAEEAAPIDEPEARAPAKPVDDDEPATEDVARESPDEEDARDAVEAAPSASGDRRLARAIARLDDADAPPPKLDAFA
jgi:hypothetical protein